MNLFQTIFYIILLCSFSSCQIQLASLEPEQELLQKACNYLWNQQSTDGGWHSATHGILRGGESLTPFILYNLMQVPNHIHQPSEEQLLRGLNFIRQHINEEGIIGCSDPDILDYPNYATAHALMILKQLNKIEDQQYISKMSDYLLSQQFTEARGFTPTDATYGGWGFGEKQLARGKNGHVDLSHTRRILEALKGHENFDEAQEKARFYFSLTQKRKDELRLHPTQTPHSDIPYDGGFFASPVTLSTNKGGIAKDSTLDANYFSSYATATCDGILGLLSANVSKEDKSIEDAKAWLEKNSLWSRPQGIPLDEPDQWHEVMFFYHLAVRSEVYAKLHFGNPWKTKLYEQLLNRQQEDGRFFNPMGGPNKEDDPLLATTFAVTALNNCQ